MKIFTKKERYLMEKLIYEYNNPLDNTPPLIYINNFLNEKNMIPTYSISNYASSSKQCKMELKEQVEPAVKNLKPKMGKEVKKSIHNIWEEKVQDSSSYRLRKTNVINKYNFSKNKKDNKGV